MKLMISPARIELQMKKIADRVNRIQPEKFNFQTLRLFKVA